MILTELSKVDAFLEAHDTSGLSEADKALAKGALSFYVFCSVLRLI
jgi:hypothetical protein